MPLLYHLIEMNYLVLKKMYTRLWTISECNNSFIFYSNSKKKNHDVIGFSSINGRSKLLGHNLLTLDYNE